MYFFVLQSSDTYPLVILFALIALEKFAQTSENKALINKCLNVNHREKVGLYCTHYNKNIEVDGKKRKRAISLLKGADLRIKRRRKTGVDFKGEHSAHVSTIVKSSSNSSLCINNSLVNDCCAKKCVVSCSSKCGSEYIFSF